jgi:hypothetical protein
MLSLWWILTSAIIHTVSSLKLNDYYGKCYHIYSDSINKDSYNDNILCEYEHYEMYSNNTIAIVTAENIDTYYQNVNTMKRWE